MRHYHFTGVLYLSMVGFLITAGVILGIYSQTQKVLADTISPFIPYDATVLSVVPNLLTIPGAQLACPYYYLMQNNNIRPDNPYPEFGLFMVPGTEADTYEYQSLVTPLSRHLGGYAPIPQPACGVTPAGTPVFPVFSNGFFFLDGGTLGPSLNY